MILSLFTGMIKNCQSTQSNNLAIALQYLKKEVGHKAFFKKIDLESFTQVIKYFNAATTFVFYCAAEHSDI